MDAMLMYMRQTDAIPLRGIGSCSRSGNSVVSATLKKIVLKLQKVWGKHGYVLGYGCSQNSQNLLCTLLGHAEAPGKARLGTHVPSTYA